MIRATIRLAYAHRVYKGDPMWLTLTVHDDLKHMRRLGERYHPWEGGFGEAVGLWQPATVHEQLINGDWVDRRPRFAGILRLTRGHIDADVVAHEAAHAALTIYRRAVGRPASFGVTCGDHEENLCYIMGDLNARIVAQLHRWGAWDAT